MSILVKEEEEGEKWTPPSVLIRLKKEVEELVKETSDKTGYNRETVRNLAVLLGLRELIPILAKQPQANSIIGLYNELLELNSRRLDNLAKEV